MGLVMAVCLTVCGCRTVKETEKRERMVARDSIVVRNSVALHDSVAVRFAENRQVVTLVRDSVVLRLDAGGKVAGKEHYRTTERTSEVRAEAAEQRKRTEARAVESSRERERAVATEEKHTERGRRGMTFWIGICGWLVTAAVLAVLAMTGRKK